MPPIETYRPSDDDDDLHPFDPFEDQGDILDEDSFDEEALFVGGSPTIDVWNLIAIQGDLLELNLTVHINEKILSDGSADLSIELTGSNGESITVQGRDNPEDALRPFLTLLFADGTELELSPEVELRKNDEVLVSKKKSSESDAEKLLGRIAELNEVFEVDLGFDEEAPVTTEEQSGGELSEFLNRIVKRSSGERDPGESKSGESSPGTEPPASGTQEIDPAQWLRDNGMEEESEE